ncbi:zinc-binding dehydrogenase [Komagataeibacter rhaeticus]|nr:zinc-binding dehydrogenase [Komagataeibacter rhaeticus]
MAIMLLAQLGYEVVAVTGRPQLHAYLTSLGAAEILPRDTLSPTGKALETARWAGGIDVVGNDALATMCASVMHGGTVAACGLAGDEPAADRGALHPAQCTPAGNRQCHVPAPAPHGGMGTAGARS